MREFALGCIFGRSVGGIGRGWVAASSLETSQRPRWLRRRGGDVYERPEMDPGDRREADPAALLRSLDDHVEHRRAWNEQQSQAGEAEHPQRAGIREDHG